MNYPRRVNFPKQFDIPHEDVMLVNAERTTKGMDAQLVSYQFLEPADHVLMPENHYWIDMCLSQRPSNSRCCYPDAWSPDRFERVGDVFLIPPNRKLRGKSDGHGLSQTLVCLIKPDTVHEWLDRELEWTDDRLAESLDVRDQNIKYVLHRLADEILHPSFAGDAMIELLEGQLSIELCRHFTATQEMAKSGGLSPHRLRLIDERLKEDYRVVTLDELAKLCNLSVRQLSRSFKASRGYSLGTYIANQRIEHAKTMLRTDQSIKRIALALGFSSSASFCYAFRRETGVSPGEFQKNSRVMIR